MRACEAASDKQVESISKLISAAFDTVYVIPADGNPVAIPFNWMPVYTGMTGIEGMRDLQ